MHRAHDAASRSSHFLVTRPGDPQLELIGTVAGVGHVRMALHQARHDHPSVGIDRLPAPQQSDFFPQIVARTHPDNAALSCGDGAPGDHPQRRASARIRPDAGAGE